jgi:DNA topoisomerase-1
MNVVVVESPAKARTINKYLGKDYTVLASYGHVRDLPAKDGSVRPQDDFTMEWEIDPRAQKHIKEIARALKGADHLYLATDPDREGEAISWHVQEVLQEADKLTGIDVKRVVFNEITRGAVLEAMRNPRELDRELIDAYLARRALDYLVGFTLSPVLWRKLPGSRSAGRVQSVALRLICDREMEIEAFRADEYWTVKAAFRTAAGQSLTAQLTHLDGVKLDKLALGDEAAATAAVGTIRAGAFAIAKVERKKTRRNPAPPFTTSTLQQEASRKLHFGAKRTMQVAQRLYEGVDIGGETVGLITYMRTDAVNMAGEAVFACRDLIGREHGDSYVPQSPRMYKTKAKNAQEAHEAIRPTDVARRPRDLAQRLDKDQLRLYELIWKRTVACQMESAVLDQVAVDVGARDASAMLRATGSMVVFDGFLRLYRESRDDAPDNDAERILPDVKEGEAMTTAEVTPEQHFTQPPPRFTEASLVKRLEELGIGRPSTYASIISVLQDREYVRLEKRRFEPEDRGRLVTAFLASFFERYVEYTFTADMENQLDDISGGRSDWKAVLHRFWGAFDKAVGETRELTITDVLEALNTLLGPHFFPANGNGGDPRACPSCDEGRLSLKVGKFGAFIGCGNYPTCRFTRPLVADGDGGANGATDNGPKHLGNDPDTGLPVWLRKGPYGLYVQLGEAQESKGKGKTKEKPKRTSLPKGMDAATLDLARALALLALPRQIGAHPESGAEIIAGLGRYGPYIRHDGKYISLKDDDVLTIGLNRAVTLIAEAPAGAKATALGDHPGDGKPVTVRAGRFGPYVQHGALRATLPKSMEPETVTLDAALALLAAKAAKGGKGAKKKPRKAAKRKKAAKGAAGAGAGNE